MKISENKELTKQELCVLRFLTEGKNNRDIAKKLSISLQTVKWHIHNILQKLNVDNRTQAVSKALRQYVIK